MAENTAIEWCDHTFNPWIGCTKVSPGCDNCYAARQDAFRKWTPEGWGGPRKRTKTWGDPVKWNDAAHEANRKRKAYGMEPIRPRVFCASLADVFDNEVPDSWRWDLFRRIAATPNLDWLLLTKRIGNARVMLNSAAAAVAGEYVGAPEWDRAPWPNVWIGATVVNQAEADRDIPKLLQVPARVRFLSIEPMLGPIDFYATSAAMGVTPRGHPWANGPILQGIHWIIAGGESGPGARPMHPDWPRSLRDQCAAAGVPFLFKQHGEWAPGSGFNLKPRAWIDRAGRVVTERTGDDFPKGATAADGWAAIHHAGKKAAGRLLDGVQHDGAPA